MQEKKNMVISMISFTGKGLTCSCEIARILQEHGMQVKVFTKCSRMKHADPACGNLAEAPVYVEAPVEEWGTDRMQEKHVLIFVGACGIAVRAIAPAVRDKQTDSPVLVIDELGHFVIPILSGHIGGANALAVQIAEWIHAVAVLTTATDLNDSFAVDIFAGENDLAIRNKEGIAKISAKILAGEKLTVSVDPGCGKDAIDKWKKEFPPETEFIEEPSAAAADIRISAEKDLASEDVLLYLVQKRYVLGIGCKKNTDVRKIEKAIAQSLAETGISKDQLGVVASVDAKKDEPGILTWSRQNRIRFVTYTADELMTLKGDFTASEFVREHVGTDNVCERAAVLACDGKGELVYRKHAYDGVTVAVAGKVADGKEDFTKN